MDFSQTSEKIIRNINRVKKTNAAWLGLILVIILWNINSNLNEYNEINRINGENNVKNAQYVNYYDSTNGILTKYKQEKFDVSKEQLSVSKVLADYLVQSAYILTNDYKNLYFENSNEFFEKNPIFKEFFKHYILYPMNGEAQTKLYNLTVSDWDQIMKWFRLAIHENNLPGLIDKKYSSIGVPVWDTKDETFKISIELPIFSTSRNNNNVIVSKKGVAIITASGFFNTLYSDSVNPRGMKFTRINIIHPVVDHGVTAETKGVGR